MTTLNTDYAQLAELDAMRRTVSTREDHFERLWISTRNLHQRFGVVPEIDRQVPLILEEITEAIAAARNEPDDALAKEITDSIVVLMGLAMARHVSLDMLHGAMNAVISKNNAKTHDTHAIDPMTLKIKRK